MIRFLINTAIYFAAALVGIIAADVILSGFSVTGWISYVTVAIIFALIQAVLCLVVYIACAVLFPSSRLFVEGSFSGYFFLWPVVYMWLSFLGIRCRYYFAWKLSEGAGDGIDE